MTSQPNFRSQALSTRAVIATFGLFTSALVLVVVATYPAFFFFNPLESGEVVRSVALLLSTIGWIQILIGPALIFGLYSIGYAKFLRALPYVAIFWPASLVLNHISLFIQEGKWYTGYLLDYPIFWVTDVLLPIMLIAVWAEMRPVIKQSDSHGVHREN
mgnify:CR=1 FL=1|jgi:hypothetical protein